MNIWSRFPFLRLTLCFMVGITLAEYVPLPGSAYTYWVFAGLAVTAITLNLIFKKRPAFAWLILLVCASFGYWRYEVSDMRKQQGLESSDACLLMTASEESLTPKNKRSYARLLSVQRDGQWYSTDEQVLLYRDEQADSLLLPPGSLLITHSEPDTVSGPTHEAQFNYAAYLRHKGIRYRFFLKSDDYILSDSVQEDARIMLERYRIRALARLTHHLDDKEVKGVLSALVLGDRADLDRETKQSYAAAGAMHVLAVSGLHVGILYGLLMAALSFLTRIRYGRYLRVSLVVALLIAYAFITGLSPSVTRAVIMFVLVATGSVLGKRAYIYNSLAVAAFISLCIDPNWLFSPGFQLSYLAVAGIVYLHPRIYQLWEPPHIIMDKIWSLSAVTLAAQVATLPLTWLYFGYFPAYFMLSNLLVIPLATVCLVTGMLKLFLGAVPFAGDAITWLCEWSVKGLNYLVSFFEQLPGSRLALPYFVAWEAFFLAFAIASALALFRSRKLKHLIISGLCLFCLALSGIVTSLGQSSQEALVWYSTGGEPYIEAIKAGDYQVITGMADDKLYGYQVDPVHRYMGVGNRTGRALFEEGGEVRAWDWQGRKFMLLQSDYRVQLSRLVEVDVLALPKVYENDLGSLLSRISFKELIVTGYVWEEKRKLLEESAREHGITLHFLREKSILMM